MQTQEEIRHTIEMAITEGKKVNVRLQDQKEDELILFQPYAIIKNVDQIKEHYDMPKLYGYIEEHFLKNKDEGGYKTCLLGRIEYVKTIDEGFKFNFDWEKELERSHPYFKVIFKFD